MTLTIEELRIKNKYLKDLVEESLLQGFDKEDILEKCSLDILSFIVYYLKYINFESIECEDITEGLINKMSQKVNEEKGPFTKDQLKEIEKGFELKKCLPIEKYFNSAYTPFQMEQIRWGLEDDLEITHYASLKFDDYQMHEIRLGLLDKIDVSSYAFPYLTDEEMCEIRRSLLNA